MATSFWKKIDQYLIHKKYHNNDFMLGKARIITLSHLCILSITLLVTALHFTILPLEHSEWLISLAMTSIMLFTFKKWGNFNLSGNLLSLSCAVTFTFSAYNTGYLNSDSFHWLTLCPVLAALFCNLGTSMFWYLYYIGVGIFLFMAQSKMPVTTGLVYTPLHYLLSYAMLTGFSTLIAALYTRSENNIFKAMLLHQEKLELHQHELNNKTDELHKLHDQLTQSNRELATFAHSAGHDLKEPLRMVSSYTSLLRRRLDSSLTGDNREFMDYITKGCQRMARLLDDLLEFSKVGTGKDKFTLVDLDDVVFFVQSNLRLAIEESAATIKVTSKLPKIQARYSEMVQLFQNIISNSIKFRKPDTPSVILISFEEKEDSYLFSIKDNGIGIPKDFQAKVFKPFERMHGNADYEGSGLGMSICYKIINNMKGKIWLESIENEGTTFYFMVPKVAQLDTPTDVPAFETMGMPIF